MAATKVATSVSAGGVYNGVFFDVNLIATTRGDRSTTASSGRYGVFRGGATGGLQSEKEEEKVGVADIGASASEVETSNSAPSFPNGQFFSIGGWASARAAARGATGGRAVGCTL